MSWAKFDDRYDDNRKIKKAWKRNRASVGLHVMAVTYCARHDTDGIVDMEWLTERLPQHRERTAVITCLVEIGLFEEVDSAHYRVHDYFHYQESRARLEERRLEERERKRSAGRKGAASRWGTPENTGDSIAPAIDSEIRLLGPSMAPDPTRPDPTNTPLPPRGNRQRDQLAFDEQVQAYAIHLGLRSEEGWRNVRGAIKAGARTDDEVRAWLQQYRPDLLEAAA